MSCCRPETAGQASLGEELVDDADEGGRAAMEIDGGVDTIAGAEVVEVEANDETVGAGGPEDGDPVVALLFGKGVA